MINLQSYLNAPDECPFCHSEDVTAGSIDYSYINAWHDVRCRKCGKEWQEEFTITKVTPYNEDGELEEV